MLHALAFVESRRTSRRIGAVELVTIRASAQSSRALPRAQQPSRRSVHFEYRDPGQDRHRIAGCAIRNRAEHPIARSDYAESLAPRRRADGFLHRSAGVCTDDRRSMVQTSIKASWHRAHSGPMPPRGSASEAARQRLGFCSSAQCRQEGAKRCRRPRSREAPVSSDDRMPCASRGTRGTGDGAQVELSLASVNGLDSMRDGVVDDHVHGLSAPKIAHTTVRARIVNAIRSDVLHRVERSLQYARHPFGACRRQQTGCSVEAGSIGSPHRGSRRTGGARTGRAKNEERNGRDQEEQDHPEHRLHARIMPHLVATASADRPLGCIYRTSVDRCAPALAGADGPRN